MLLSFTKITPNYFVSFILKDIIREAKRMFIQGDPRISFF